MRWNNDMGLSHPHATPQEGNKPYPPAAPYAGPQGPHPRSQRAVRPVRVDRAMAAVRSIAAGSRTPAIPRGSRQARRHVGMHPLLLLLHIMPKLLVEPGQISWSFDPAAILPLACRYPRPAHG